ncbi:glycosyltransferase family 4 protein [uncultured Algibacter sp.]|uniref:glycosyltransferase family 4 protein n=1 Tax=uncultured Algibacter sp. TaxID=298659 RepID=UPI002616C274|nr:glycosyltransferase family 4 protein [uncultured Algibacter sp.]
MKILMVSMSSIHFFRWTNQLKDSGHEVYWFDINDGNRKVDAISWVNQIVGWKRIWDFPGRFFIKKRFPNLYKKIQFFNDRKTSKVFEKLIQDIKPDIVQSFVMYMSCVPILNVMKKYPDIKWIYSAWGNDLYYYQNEPKYLEGIRKTLPQIDYLFTDCERDYHIAKNHGFKGKYLGTYPGGGGYVISDYENFVEPFEVRKIILIKGYQHKFGRCNLVLDAIYELKNYLTDFDIVVFSDNELVRKHIEFKGFNLWGNFKCTGKLTHKELLKLMGQAYIYIGSSISDGMPNTLLEAIIMGAYPIQSNPGGATSEIINDGQNGTLIHNSEDVSEIKNKIEFAINNEPLLEEAFKLNRKLRHTLEYSTIKNRVLKKYNELEHNTINL